MLQIIMNKNEAILLAKLKLKYITFKNEFRLTFDKGSRAMQDSLKLQDHLHGYREVSCWDNFSRGVTVTRKTRYLMTECPS